jgi:biotin synthase
MADAPDVSVFDTVRMIATTRIVMPRAVVRLSAGRAKMSQSDQTLCFMAGANSIFSSDAKIMLTKAVPSHSYDEDQALFKKLDIKIRKPFKDYAPRAAGAADAAADAAVAAAEPQPA